MTTFVSPFSVSILFILSNFLMDGKVSESAWNPEGKPTSITAMLLAPSSVYLKKIKVVHHNIGNFATYQKQKCIL